MLIENIVSRKPVCKCVFCNHGFHDTSSLEEYIHNLEETIELQKQALEEIDDLPIEILARITKIFEVDRARALNLKDRMINENAKSARRREARHHC